ncbi:MAG: SH3 domain-containing protein, partial [Ruminococcus sp.]|nr:SH3 domain-containing protein [Ruminococcus sp.]
MGLFGRALSALCASAVALTMVQLSALNASAKTGVVTADSLNVRTGAGTNNSIITSISEGTSVTIKGEANDSSGQKWYKITAGGTTGYVSAWYIDVVSNSDTAASSSTSTASNTTAANTETTAKTGMSDKEFESYMKSQGFPDSYKPMLRELHKDHPNWIFMAQKTGLDWNYVLKEECVLGRSLVPSYALDSWKSMKEGAYDPATGTWYGLDGSWVQASDEIIAYYLDPRNFLDDTNIFMFENLSYNPSVHNIDGVKAILADTFMKGSFTAPDTGVKYSYAQTFMDAAKQSGVSPYHLAARCRNEQGVSGAPQSLGTTP